MTIRPPGLILSAWSVLWFVVGGLGLVLIVRGSYLLGGLGLSLGLLTAGLWLQWSFVRWPLIIYTLIIGLCGVYLLAIRPFEFKTAVQAFGFLHFSYLVFRWRPHRQSAGVPIGADTPAF